MPLINPDLIILSQTDILQSRGEPAVSEVCLADFRTLDPTVARLIIAYLQDEVLKDTAVADLFALFLVGKRDSWLWLVYDNEVAANAHRDHVKQAITTKGRAHFGLKSMGVVDAFVMKHPRGGVRSHFPAVRAEGGE